MEKLNWKDKLNALIEKDETLKKEVEKIQEETKKSNSINKQSITIEMDKSGRCGKKATLLYGFSCSDDEVKEIAKDLKKKFCVGGSVRGNEILLQGDLKAKVSEYLCSLGHKTKII